MGFIEAVQANPAWFFNLAWASIMFFMLALPTLSDYSYQTNYVQGQEVTGAEGLGKNGKSESSQGTYGQHESGELGSGVGAVCTFLFVVTIVGYFKQIFATMGEAEEEAKQE